MRAMQAGSKVLELTLTPQMMKGTAMERQKQTVLRVRMRPSEMPLKAEAKSRQILSLKRHLQRIRALIECSTPEVTWSAVCDPRYCRDMGISVPVRMIQIRISFRHPCVPMKSEITGSQSKTETQLCPLGNPQLLGQVHSSACILALQQKGRGSWQACFSTAMRQALQTMQKIQTREASLRGVSRWTTMRKATMKKVLPRMEMRFWTTVTPGVCPVDWQLQMKLTPIWKYCWRKRMLRTVETVRAQRGRTMPNRRNAGILRLYYRINGHSSIIIAYSCYSYSLWPLYSLDSYSTIAGSCPAIAELALFSTISISSSSAYSQSKAASGRISCTSEELASEMLVRTTSAKAWPSSPPPTSKTSSLSSYYESQSSSSSSSSSSQLSPSRSSYWMLKLDCSTFSSSQGTACKFHAAPSLRGAMGCYKVIGLRGVLRAVFQRKRRQAASSSASCWSSAAQSEMIVINSIAYLLRGMVTCVSQSRRNSYRAAWKEGNSRVINRSIIDPTDSPSSHPLLLHFVKIRSGVQTEYSGCGRIGFRREDLPSRTTDAWAARASQRFSASSRDFLDLFIVVIVRSSQMRMSLFWKRVRQCRKLGSVRGAWASILRYSKTFSQSQSKLEWQVGRR